MLHSPVHVILEYGSYLERGGPWAQSELGVSQKQCTPWGTKGMHWDSRDYRGLLWDIPDIILRGCQVVIQTSLPVRPRNRLLHLAIREL